MVECFNRRLGDHLNRMPQNRAAHHRRFLDHAERDAYLHTFVADYNHTRLRCLDYQAPAELLAKLTGHNTCAGAGVRTSRAWAAVPTWLLISRRWWFIAMVLQIGMITAAAFPSPGQTAANT